MFPGGVSIFTKLFDLFVVVSQFEIPEGRLLNRKNTSRLGGSVYEANSFMPVCKLNDLNTH